MEILQTCPPHLSDVATLPWEIQKKSFSTVSVLLTVDMDWYLPPASAVGSDMLRSEVGLRGATQSC